jgi:hypothetical protein
MLPRDITVQLGPVSHTLRQGTPIYSRDFAVLRMLQDNLGRRPIGWSLTTGGEYFGLDRYILQQGLVMQLQTAPVDTTRTDVDNRRILGTALDVPTTERLLWETYRYAGLLTDRPKVLEPTAAGIANNLSLPFSQLAYFYEGQGDRAASVRNLTRAGQLSTSPGFQQALSTLLDASQGDSQR